jgi:RNA 3'-terminal phosphate cyclase
MNELVDMLVKAGSTAALAEQVGDEAAASALEQLKQSAPMEVRESWPLVIAWGRYQKSYEVAVSLGDSSGMIKASDAQRKLLMDLY